jgi:hypothetical protein
MTGLGLKSRPPWWKSCYRWPKAKYNLLSHNEIARQDHDMKTADRSSENVAEFMYFETIETKKKLVEEEIKRRLNCGNACYHSLHKGLFHCLLKHKNENVQD